MATARLYADENFKRAAVEELRRLGHDVLTVQEAGQQGGNDPQVLANATALGRAVLTFNRRHFIRLHMQSSAHAGIIVCTDAAAMALATRIDRAIQADPNLACKLIRINRPP
jgi:sugar phosphate isomerase/epimerase